MKRTVITTLIFLMVSAIANPALSKYMEDDTDKTLSPYFFVKSDNSSVDQLPLKSTSAEVTIAGVISDVKVTQVYKNEGEHALEAIYIFPASTRAAVYGMEMTIGERVIKAEVKERQQARKAYEKAKKEGKSASLLEQQRPNVFQMNVANILPGDEIKVELKYTELLVPVDGVYEFVYPAVVGPRYSNQPAATAPSSEKWVQNPYLHEGEKPPYEFDIKVDISAGLPIQQATCTSHKVDVGYESESLARITLDASEKTGGDRDFILKYQLAGSQIQSGLLLYQGEAENFFLLMVQPPKKVEADQIPLREYIFIVDVSGSMHGFPLNISKKLLQDLIGNLRPEEKFNVLLFAGNSAVLSEEGSLLATEKNIQKAIDVINNQQGGGGTEILPALKRALALPRGEGISRTVVVVTDGYVTVEPEVFDLIRNNLGNANLFAFGIGSGVNRHIIEGMAHVGMGEPFVVTKSGEASQAAEKFRTYIQSPVLSGVTIDFGKFQVYDVEPLAVPDVLAERPIISFGKWNGDPQGKITVGGMAGDKKFEQTFEVGDTKPLAVNAALKYLWARYRITILGDYNHLRRDDDRIKQITDLGLHYNLLTQYTSFVAVDYLVRKDPDGTLVTVKQPLPLPSGVSDTAVGFEPDLGEHVSFANAPAAGLYAKQMQKTKKEKPYARIDTQATKEGITVLSPGKISPEALTELIAAKFKTIDVCKAYKKGKAELKVTIDKSGKVIAVEVGRDEIGGPVIQCLINTVSSWNFKELKNNDTVTVFIPVIFSFKTADPRTAVTYQG